MAEISTVKLAFGKGARLAVLSFTGPTKMIKYLPAPDGLETKAAPDEFKMVDADQSPGVLEGYAAVFGNPDRDDDIIVPGAFTAGLDDFKACGFLCDAHDWRSELGTILEAKEDDHGLWVQSEFYPTPDAQNARAKLVEKLKRGRAQQMSIGFRVLKSEAAKGHRRITEIELYEVSIVSVAANPATRVTAVKAVHRDLDAELEQRRAALRRIAIARLVRA
jgi:HK97 family phage prohead protease